MVRWPPPRWPGAANEPPAASQKGWPSNKNPGLLLSLFFPLKLSLARPLRSILSFNGKNQDRAANEPLKTKYNQIILIYNGLGAPSMAGRRAAIEPLAHTMG